MHRFVVPFTRGIFPLASFVSPRTRAEIHSRDRWNHSRQTKTFRHVKSIFYWREFLTARDKSRLCAAVESSRTMKILFSRRFPRGRKSKVRVLSCEYAELQRSGLASLEISRRGLENATTAWHSSHVVAPFVSQFLIPEPRFSAPSTFSRGFQLFSLCVSSPSAARQKETVSTEPVMEEGFTHGWKRRRRRRLRSRWVQSLSEIPFRSCKVSYLRRFMRRLGLPFLLVFPYPLRPFRLCYFLLSSLPPFALSISLNTFCKTVCAL